MTIPCPHNGVHAHATAPIYCLRQRLEQAEAAFAALDSRAADRIRAEAFEEAARLAENCDGNNVTLLDLSLALRKQAISLRQEAGGEGA